jgi:hypothetical protein
MCPAAIVFSFTPHEDKFGPVSPRISLTLSDAAHNTFVACHERFSGRL